MHFRNPPRTSALTVAFDRLSRRPASTGTPIDIPVDLALAGAWAVAGIVISMAVAVALPTAEPTGMLIGLG